jgi:hypothetical protein
MHPAKQHPQHPQQTTSRLFGTFHSFQEGIKLPACDESYTQVVLQIVESPQSSYRGIYLLQDLNIEINIERHCSYDMGYQLTRGTDISP